MTLIRSSQDSENLNTTTEPLILENVRSEGALRVFTQIPKLFKVPFWLVKVSPEQQVNYILRRLFLRVGIVGNH